MQNKSLIPWVLGLGLLMETLDSTVLNTALPQMAQSFDVNALTLKLAIVSYFITLAVFIPVSGYATDRWGTKRVFFYATVAFLLSSLLCGFSQNIFQLVIGRLFQGLGGAMITPVGRMILLKTFERKEFIKAFTSLVLVGQFGVVCGPMLGGALTTFLGWRWVFFVNLPVGFLLLILIVRVIPNYQEAIRYHFDKLGFVFFSIAVGLITFGLALVTEESFQDVETAGVLFGIGVVLLMVYIWHARRLSLPLLNLKLFRVRTFRVAILGSFLVRLPLNAPFFLLMLLFQIEFGFSALVSGLFLMPFGFAMMTMKTYFQRVLRRCGFRRSLMLNPVLLMLSLLTFTQVTAATPAWTLLLLVGFLGVVSSFQFTCMNTLNFVDIEKQEMSHASMIGSVLQQLAMSFSVCFSAGLLILVSRFHHVATLNVTAFHTTFYVLGGVSLLSILIFRRLQPEDGRAMLQ
ncbi:MAG: MFS transporter [Gammaproteobacteria bacterium]|nr:MFS transporter [Gammaproteobacteria bacterium]